VRSILVAAKTLEDSVVEAMAVAWKGEKQLSAVSFDSPLSVWCSHHGMRYDYLKRMLQVECPCWVLPEASWVPVMETRLLQPLTRPLHLSFYLSPLPR
jgi:hypothetical protein